MGKIKVLPDIIANQIAAGEVVERPSAIVKELVENSLDANATHIRVRFKQGGKTYISVEDNGDGMAADDALLCLQRHATSKIRTTQDLLSISSFGFRGEAIPSIASVSSFTLKSRNKGAEQGTETIVNAGNLLDHKVSGMPEGTQIEVSQLFKNMPARRKFLKTDATEANHIIKTVKYYAMAYPKVGFTLEEDNKTILHTPPTTSLKSRLEEIYGSGLIDTLIPITNAKNIYGMISKPGTQGKNHREDMLTFVNLRPIENKMMYYALLESFSTFIPKGRFPIAFLFLSVDPATIDVNIHPNKKEIKFAQEGLLRSQLIATLTETLLTYQNNNKRELIAPTAWVPEVMQIRENKKPSLLKIPTITSIARPNPQPSFAKANTLPDQIPQTAINALKAHIPSEQASSATSFTDSWDFLCSLPKHYSLFKTDDKLIILNHRAAHERILFESILEHLRQECIPAQNLLFPVTVELPLSEDFDLTTLEPLGIRVDVFGKNTLKVQTIPQWLPIEQIETYIQECLKICKIPQKDTLLETFAQKASALAIQSNDPVNEEMIKKIIHRLMQCQQPMTTPSGKAVYWAIPFSEIDKKFSRNESTQNPYMLNLI